MNRENIMHETIRNNDGIKLLIEDYKLTLRRNN